ncbi:MAG: hypothetical protein ACH350_02225 [Parachlamydiaceae bacterium]
MNISSYYQSNKDLYAATLGLVVFSYMGLFVVKWVLKKTDLINCVNKIIEDLLFKNQSNNVSNFIKTKKNFEKVDPFKISKNPSISNFFHSNLLNELQNKHLDLINDEFPQGISQYRYPDFSNGNIPHACSFHSAAFILYMKEHFNEVVESFRHEHVDVLVDIYKKILDKGLIIRNEALDNGMVDESINPEEMKRYTTGFDSIKIGQPEQVITGLSDIKADFDSEFNKLFSLQEPTKHSYCLIQADGQTFAFCHINQHQGFLFDPHKSSVKVVSKEEAKHYLTHDILDLDGIESAPQIVDFYHGFFVETKK